MSNEIGTSDVATDVSFKLINSNVLPLTPALAQEFHTLTPSPTERPLDQGRLNMLKRKAELGQLVSFQWAKARLGSEVLRMNGQHSSAMLCELNGAFPDGLMVHLDEYQVQNERGLAALFQQFDDRKSSRTARDVAGACQNTQDNAAVRDVPRDRARLAVDGVAWYRMNIIGLPSRGRDAQYQYFYEDLLHPFIIWAGSVLDSKTRELQKVPVVAAMFRSFEVNEEEARAFWSMVARGGPEFDETHPATLLENWLKHSFEEHEKYPQTDYFAASKYAWDAYRNGKTFTKIRVDKKTIYSAFAE